MTAIAAAELSATAGNPATAMAAAALAARRAAAWARARRCVRACGAMSPRDASTRASPLPPP